MEKQTFLYILGFKISSDFYFNDRGNELKVHLFD